MADAGVWTYSEYDSALTDRQFGLLHFHTAENKWNNRLVPVSDLCAQRANLTGAAIV